MWQSSSTCRPIGNSRVLKAMNRGYTREQYLEKVRMARSLMPDIVLTSDIIIGFPGETEAEAMDTVSLIEEVGYDALFTFIYSPRPGTPAAAMPDPATRAEKQVWFDKLVDAQNRISGQLHHRYVGKTVRVLVDGESGDAQWPLQSRTEGGRLVHLRGTSPWWASTSRRRSSTATPGRCSGRSGGRHPRGAVPLRGPTAALGAGLPPAGPLLDAQKWAEKPPAPFGLDPRFCPIGHLQGRFPVATETPRSLRLPRNRCGGCPTSAIAPRAEGWFYQRLQAGQMQAQAEGFMEQVLHLCGTGSIVPWLVGHVQPPLLRGEGLCQSIQRLVPALRQDLVTRDLV